MLTDDELGTIQQAANMLDVLRVLDMHQNGCVNDALAECREAQREMAAKLRAIAAPRVATPNMETAIKSVESIKTTSAALGYSQDYMTALDRVLTCLRAVEQNGGPLTSTVDAAHRVATVGELLATARDGFVIEFIDEEGAGQPTQISAEGENINWRMFDDCWHQWWCVSEIATRWLTLNARLVSASDASGDPRSRVPIGGPR